MTISTERLVSTHSFATAIPVGATTKGPASSRDWTALRSSPNQCRNRIIAWLSATIQPDRQTARPGVLPNDRTSTLRTPELLIRSN